MPSDFEKISDIKLKLDNINYGGEIPLVSKETGNWEFHDYTVNNIVNNDIAEIEKRIEGSDLHIGVISAGTHTRDYQKAFDFKVGKEWSYEPVMFLYECPGANLNASFYGKYDGKFQFAERDDSSVYTAEDISRESVYNKLLCNHIWRINPAVDCYGNFEFFGNKKYDEFILSVIKTFKLANFYTTNFFRYELYRIKDGKESALNFGAIQDATDGKVFPTKSFKAELNAFKPEVIFATSNPYNWLLNNWDKSKFKFDKPLIIKVPHPANRDTCPDRFLKNALNINAGLEKSHVITKQNSDKMLKIIYDKYVKMLKGEDKEETAEA